MRQTILYVLCIIVMVVIACYLTYLDLKVKVAILGTEYLWQLAIGIIAATVFAIWVWRTK